MADLSDVSNALGLLCQNALYPDQVISDGRPSPVVGIPVLIQIGWPDPASLEKLIAARNGMVTIYPRPTEKITTRNSRVWSAGPKTPATFTLTLAGSHITVGGAAPAPYFRHNVCVFANAKPYIYSTVNGDGVAAVAAGLAALIAVDIPGTTASGAVLSLPGTARIGALRVGTGANAIQEVKRQEREFQITIWAASLDGRDKIAPPIDLLIAMTTRMALADGTNGKLTYRSSPYTDVDQKTGIFRRDLIVTVEYVTTNMDFAPEVVAAETITSQKAGNGSTITPPISTNFN
jgi:hypothetical protein